MRREKLGQIKIRIADLVRREQAHWASLITTLIINNTACYDGQTFFYTAHTEGDSGSQSNDLSASDYSSLDIGTAGAPTAAEAQAMVQEVIGHFYTLKDDQGQPINEDANQFTIVCPTPKMYQPILTAVTKMTLTTSGGASVDNPLVGVGWTPKVVLNSRFTSSEANYFWVLRSGVPMKPFIRQQEGSLVNQILDEESDHYFMEDEILIGLKANRAAGYGFWQYALRALTS